MDGWCANAKKKWRSVGVRRRKKERGGKNKKEEAEEEEKNEHKGMKLETLDHAWPMAISLFTMAGVTEGANW